MTDDDFYKDGYEDWHKNEKSNVIKRQYLTSTATTPAS